MLLLLTALALPLPSTHFQLIIMNGMNAGVSNIHLMLLATFRMHV